jgi:hypothetical protein
VRSGHQVEGLVARDLRRVEVENRRESEAAALDRPDPDACGDARVSEVELSPGSKPQQRRLEAGCIAQGEELLGIRPRPAPAAHLARHVEVDVEAAVAGAAMTLATACDGCFGGVEDLRLVVHGAFSFQWRCV